MAYKAKGRTSVLLRKQLANRTSSRGVKRKDDVTAYLPKTADGKVKGGPGRPRGLKNKIGQEAKIAIAMAFEGLGGVPGMIEWAKKSDTNRAVFYNIYSKLIPIQVQGKIEHNVDIDGAEESAALKLAFLSVINARARGGPILKVIDGRPVEEAKPLLELPGPTGTEATADITGQQPSLAELALPSGTRSREDT